MNSVEKTLSWLGVYKDGITVFCLVPCGLAVVSAAIWTMITWSDQRERELMKPIFEQHIKVTSSVYELVAKMGVEKNPEQLKALSSQFWAIYHGPATQFLTPESMKSLQWTASHVARCIDKHPERDPAHPMMCDMLQMSTSGLAENARLDLSARLIKDGLKGMATLKSSVPREYQH